MKTISTLLLASFTLFFFGTNATAQNCNTTAGGNGISSALTGGISIDGNMADWAPYLNDPDNNSYDASGSNDQDAPFSEDARDLLRLTFTEDANYLYFNLQRAGSTSNTIDIVFYLDINNNDLMESGEPVYHISWAGTNGSVSIEVLNYQPSTAGIHHNTLSQHIDGSKLMGTLTNRSGQGPGISTGSGSSDGKSVEIKIPFSQITRVNDEEIVTGQLYFGQDFKFHISTINSNVSSIPAANSINDNFGGCLNAPSTNITLPVKLESFNAFLSDPSKVDLKWVTTSEINVKHFVVEKSYDGVEFNDAATVFASGNTTGKVNYSATDNIANATAQIVYYRLRSVDINGKTSYSEIRIIRLSKQTDNTVTILSYPNPAINELRITIPANWQNKKVVYELFSANGQAAKKIEASSSSQTETLNISSLKSGFYIVKVSCGIETAQQKIIKQ